MNWNKESILHTFSALAGLALGSLIYSYIVWSTDFPIILIGYWFGISNFTLVFGITITILITYLIYLVSALTNKRIHRKIKVWAVVSMLLIAGISEFTLSFSQRFRKMNGLDNGFYKHTKRHVILVDQQDYQ